jgi:hypothetical protein
VYWIAKGTKVADTVLSTLHHGIDIHRQLASYHEARRSPGTMCNGTRTCIRRTACDARRHRCAGGTDAATYSGSARGF